MTREQAKAFVGQVANAILETVTEAGAQGCPVTPLYLALQAKGASHQFCEGIVLGLVAIGKVKLKNHTLYALPAKTGWQFKARTLERE